MSGSFSREELKADTVRILDRSITSEQGDVAATATEEEVPSRSVFGLKAQCAWRWQSIVQRYDRRTLSTSTITEMSELAEASLSFP